MPPTTHPTPTLLAALTLAVTGCDTGGPRGNDEDPVEDPAATLEVEVHPSELTGPEGRVLLRIEELGGSIQVEPGSSFGAATRFLDAAPGPEGEGLAVVSAGTSHGAGWFVDLEGGTVHPAAFQYGGSVSLGPWSDDGRWMVFIHEGPAGDRTLTVADRTRPAATVDEATLPVRVPGHDDLPPEERDYEVQEWAEGRLTFRLSGTEWLMDPLDGEVEPREGSGGGG